MTTLDEATRRALAVKASCDPRTIDKVARGAPVRGLAGHRARAALEEAGIEVPRPTVRGRAAGRSGDAASNRTVKP